MWRDLRWGLPQDIRLYASWIYVFLCKGIVVYLWVEPPGNRNFRVRGFYLWEPLSLTVLCSGNLLFILITVIKGIKDSLWILIYCAHSEGNNLNSLWNCVRSYWFYSLLIVIISSESFLINGRVDICFTLLLPSPLVESSMVQLIRKDAFQ